MVFDDSIFHKYNIEYSAAVPFDTLRIINPRRLQYLKKALEPRSAVVFLVPYYTGEGEGRNLSRYAVSRDYHLYMNRLFESLCPELEQTCGGVFRGMADSAPCDEASAAAYAGLGLRGDNGLLINEKYGSYVFIGAVYTDAVFDSAPDKTALCEHCGSCRAACLDKNGRGCLSAVTQKKGELTDDEKQYILEYGSVWGCDICSEVCPHNAHPALTPIKFFYEDRIFHLTSEIVEKMTDEELAARAFGWRGRSVPLRNCRMMDEVRGNSEE